MGIKIVTDGTTGLQDGDLVDESNRLVFTSTTPLEVHVRCDDGYWSADQAFLLEDEAEVVVPIEVSFDAGGTWEAWADNPVCPEIEDVNFPVLLRQPEAFVGTLDTEFRTDGSFSAIAALGQVVGLTATPSGSTGVNLSWTALANRTYYKIERATDSGFTANLTVLSSTATATTYADTGLTAGTTYYYRVTGLGTGRYSNGTASASANATPLAAGITHFTVGDGPIGLAVDQHGNVWAACNLDSTLRRITPGGTVTSFNMADSSDDPIAIVSDGTNLYVTHSTGLTKVSGDLTGTPTIARYTAVGATYGAAIGGDGYLYATDAGTNVRKIDISGTPALVTAWGTSGVKSVGGGSLRSIVAGDSGFLYCTNRTDRQVIKVPEANATALSNIGTCPDASADLMDIAYDGTDLYCVGQGTGKIYRVTLAGSYTGTVVGAAGSQPTGIAISAGRVYTAGYNASYANIYSIATGATPGTPTNHGALTAGGNWDVVAKPDGTIWVAEYGSDKVARLVL